MVRNYFAPSVLPIDVTEQDNIKDIGTCFVIDSNRVMTARHCIEGKKNIKIVDQQNQILVPRNVWTPSDDTDVAVIEMDNHNLSSLPRIGLDMAKY